MDITQFRMESYTTCHSRLATAGRSPTSAPQPLLHLGPSSLRMSNQPLSVTRHMARAASAPSSAPTPKMARDFQPSIWGDFFIRYNQSMQKSEKSMEERASELKKEVRELFEACKEDVVAKMNLVDVLQRLGIDYHFEEQIANALSSIHSAEFNSSSLHEVALRFRLLRQQGYWVSPDEFNKFRCEDGSFAMDLSNDPKGLLSLYNAANLLTHNEGVLEEAILFARHHLESMTSSLKSPLVGQVARALQIPLPRTLKRVEALNYISEYSAQENTYYSPSILELAKLDFNILQNLHQKELKAISQWWEDLSREIGLDYVRDRAVECYFVSYTAYYEQEHARARMILAKIIVLISIMDDTYDVHATLEESRKLNEALHRWDESAVSLLPEYMKELFLSMIRNFREFEDELEPHEKYRSAYNRKAFQILSSYYLQEAEWFHRKYIPSFKEQADVSIITGGGLQLCVGLLVGMGDVATKEAFDWAIGWPEASRACGQVGRFRDDLATVQNGKDKMDVATSVECYMKEHNVTSEVAMEKISCLVDDAWKTLNQARFEQHALLPVVERVINMAMCTELMFHDKRDGYTDSEVLKDVFESHFIRPIPL